MSLRKLYEEEKDRSRKMYTAFVYARTLSSPLGFLTIKSEGSSITELSFGKQVKMDDGNDRIVKQCEKELQECFSGTRTAFTVPFLTKGTDFQKKVWDVIARIPFGKTITYTELAKRAGKPKAIRAAASACGKNPIVVMIPCHRVVSSNGELGGYNGGIKKKQWLLQHERSV